MTILNPDNGKHWHEDMMLDYIIKSLEHTKRNPAEIKERIVNPLFAGELSIPPSSGDNWISYVGLSYDITGSVGQTNTIEGVMLNMFGINIIRGTVSETKKFRDLTFDAQLITIGKLSDNISHYHCLKAPNSELYAGGINNYRRGRIRLYDNYMLKKDLLNKKYPDVIAINHAIEEYYKEFVVGADLGFHDESITKPTIQEVH